MSETEKKTLDPIMTALICLAGYAVNNKTCEIPDIANIDWELLWQQAKRQSLTSTIAVAVENLRETDYLNIPPEIRENLHNSRLINLRRRVLFDDERKEIYQWMSQQDIRHMSLKGILIQDLYPVFEMREMSDNDILYDAERKDDVKTFFERRGYRFSVFHNVDDYRKEPIFHFEMHRDLFAVNSAPEKEKFFADILERSEMVPDSPAECRMNINDFYLFFLAHVQKHVYSHGSGLRPLLDGYLICQKYASSFDRSYIQDGLVRMKMLDFEETIRNVWEKLFSRAGMADFDALTDQEYALLNRMASEAVYGSNETFVKNLFYKETGEELQKGSGWKYVLRRIIPSWSYMKACYPKVARTPFLLLFMYIVRPFHRLFTSWKKAWNELKAVKKIEK